MAKYYIPGIGGQIQDVGEKPYQSAPLLNTYSPRLFGAPPQLTHLNDMRLMSANPDKDGTPGPVGDFYLSKILRDSQIANFVVGRALFTGGMSSLANIIRVVGQYAYALSKYDVLQTDGSSATAAGTAESIMKEANINTYNKALSEDTGWTEMKSGSSLGLDDDVMVADLDSLGNSKSLIESIGSALSSAYTGFTASLFTSLSIQQPFYTFEADWNSYINNVKMMINTAVIMLGLQNACVRIGDNYYPIGMNVDVTKDNDVWSNYRFITPSTGLGDVNAIDNQSGDNSQYVSFMVQNASFQESYNNTTGASQIYGTAVSKGDALGSEIAFLTNSSQSKIDDAVLNIADKTTAVAEKVLTSMTAGIGRFTAAILGSSARSFLGDHAIYPEIFTSHTSTTSMEIVVKLSASSGDPYAYLTEILVPLFFILGMGLPNMSKNNAAAYAFPPLVQCSIPGYWGTRLGIVESISVSKNPNGKDVSVNGYPLAVDVTIRVKDLQHVLMTSGMNKVSTFLNNHTMFDYIAQCAGVDKYRVNGSVRLVSRLALAASASGNIFHNLGDAILNDFTSFANRKMGTYRL